VELNLNLHPKQGEVLKSVATELLYGGAAGGGKSHLMRVLSILWCSIIPGLQVYLFRRIRGDLEKNHIEGPSGYRALLAPWVISGLVQIVEEEIRFWNGSKIYLCHCKDEKDRFKYQGAEIHVLLIDELTHFTDVIYRFLRNRVRMVGITVPAEWEGCFPRIICGSNPGGIGHQFVKTTFIDDASPMELRRMPDNEGGMLRQYIPALLEDNPSMAEDDPSYEARLMGLGSKALVEAMRFGNWDVVEGAFFDCWSAKNVIRPFKVPDHWTKFRSFDWGSAKPFSVGWWAVVQDDFKLDGVVLPRGALVRYREWYGCAKDENGATIPDKGLKLTVEKVAEGILEREGDEIIDYGVADTSIFDEDGGPSQAERMGDKGVYWIKADKRRIPGWDQCRQRIEGEHGRPMAYWFNTCTDSIRTIPSLQHDERKPEDLDTSQEDHAADEVRYGFMSRPWTKEVEEAKPTDRWDRAFNEDDEEDSWRIA